MLPDIATDPVTSSEPDIVCEPMKLFDPVVAYAVDAFPPTAITNALPATVCLPTASAIVPNALLIIPNLASCCAASI
jgi:hypothetical protein